MLLLVGIALQFSVACAKPVEVRVRTNGTFAPDGTRTLLVETRYLTPEPEQPWYYAPAATQWRAVFFEAQADLSNPREVATFTDLAEQGGGLQSVPVFWVPEKNRAVAIEYNKPTLFDLTTGRRTILTLPAAEKTRLFRRPKMDLTDATIPMALAPSPEGSRVAVFYSASFAGPGGVFDMRFVHAIAFFSIEGTFQRAVALTPWDGTDEDLNLDLPPPSPPLPNPPPPAPNVWTVVPGHYNTRFVWTKDGAAVLVVDLDRNENGSVEGKAWRIEAETGATREVEQVPTRALPTRGGAVSPAGMLLVVRHSSRHPNEDALSLYQLDDWIPFDALAEIAVTSATYAR